MLANKTFKVSGSFSKWVTKLVSTFSLQFKHSNSLEFSITDFVL